MHQPHASTYTNKQKQTSGRGGGRGGGRYGAGRKTLNQQGVRSKGGNFFGAGAAEGATAGGPTAQEVAAKAAHEDALDLRMGFPLFTEGPDRLGWLLNFTPCSLEDPESGKVLSAIACYFIQQDGAMFKGKYVFHPYFYVQVRGDAEAEVEAFLRKRFEGFIAEARVVEREDLALKNHLAGLRRRLLQLSFYNVQQLMEVRRALMQVVQRRRNAAAAADTYELLQRELGAGAAPASSADFLECVVELREHDVPYHVRWSIDTDVRASRWYTVAAAGGRLQMACRADLLQRAEPRIVAFDIETTKLPLQFPNAEFDQVFMISYMVDRQGYLIVNREVVAEDIRDFEYTPKPEYDGPFTVFNEPDERATLRCWLNHMQRVKVRACT